MIETGNDLKDNPSLEAVLGLSIIHEAGHNETSISHDQPIRLRKDFGFMKPGNELNNGKLSDIPSLAANERIVEIWNNNMRAPSVAGPPTEQFPLDSDCDRAPVDNYQLNKVNRSKQKQQ